MKLFLFAAAILAVVVQINALTRFAEGDNNHQHHPLLNKLCKNFYFEGMMVHDGYLDSEHVDNYVVDYARHLLKGLNPFMASLAQFTVDQSYPQDNNTIKLFLTALKRDRFNYDIGATDGSVLVYLEYIEDKLEAIAELDTVQFAFYVPNVHAKNAAEQCLEFNNNGSSAATDERNVCNHDILDMFQNIYAGLADLHTFLTAAHQDVHIKAIAPEIENMMNIFTAINGFETRDALHKFQTIRHHLYPKYAIPYEIDLFFELLEETIEALHQTGRGNVGVVLRKVEQKTNVKEYCVYDFDAHSKDDHDLHLDIVQLLIEIKAAQGQKGTHKLVPLTPAHSLAPGMLAQHKSLSLDHLDLSKTKKHATQIAETRKGRLAALKTHVTTAKTAVNDKHKK